MIDSYKEKIKSKIEEFAKARGLDLVDFKLSFYGTKYTVRCLVDYPQGGVTVNECAALNGEIFSFLDISSLLGEDFVVEVNSPGLDRLLKTYKDFLRVKERDICLWLSESVEAKEYLEGKLFDINEEQLFLKQKDKIYKIGFNKIKVGKEKVQIESR